MNLALSLGGLTQMEQLFDKFVYFRHGLALVVNCLGVVVLALERLKAVLHVALVVQQKDLVPLVVCRLVFEVL